MVIGDFFTSNIKSSFTFTAQLNKIIEELGPPNLKELEQKLRENNIQFKGYSADFHDLNNKNVFIRFLKDLDSADKLLIVSMPRDQIHANELAVVSLVGGNSLEFYFPKTKKTTFKYLQDFQDPKILRACKIDVYYKVGSEWECEHDNHLSAVALC